jgi:hypothetical protein
MNERADPAQLRIRGGFSRHASLAGAFVSAASWPGWRPCHASECHRNGRSRRDRQGPWAQTRNIGAALSFSTSNPFRIVGNLILIDCYRRERGERVLEPARLPPRLCLPA